MFVVVLFCFLFSPKIYLLSKSIMILSLKLNVDTPQTEYFGPHKITFSLPNYDFNSSNFKFGSFVALQNLESLC